MTRRLPPTAARSPSSSSSSGSPATRASRSCSTRRPATAATPSTGWADSGALAMWASRISRSVGGSRGPVVPGRRAASSSSAKNGLPSERSKTSATRSERGLLAEDGRHQGRESRLIEPEELDALHAPAALELGEPRQQRMASVELVGAVCADQRRPARSRGPGPGMRSSRAWPRPPSGGPRGGGGPAIASRVGSRARGAPRRGVTGPTRTGPEPWCRSSRSPGPDGRGPRLPGRRASRSPTDRGRWPARGVPRRTGHTAGSSHRRCRIRRAGPGSPAHARCAPPRP